MIPSTGRRSAAELFDLTGRTALVTGGGTHLGRAMAEGLAEQGARVILAGRRTDVVEASAAAMRAAGLSARAVTLDVTDPDQVERVFEGVATDDGPLDILVCDAGASFDRTYPPEAELDAFRRTMDVNAVGTLLCAQAAARQMAPQGKGAIVTVSSIHGWLTADPRLYEGIEMDRSGPAYQASKAAVLALTRNLAAELGPSGIRVNCISPGYFPHDRSDPRFIERCRQRNPLGTFGSPEDIKGAVILLASDAGRFMTGSNVMVDGGWSIW
jgi:NAD(P)-dependent dehydrogenase (short-subunit alcohol dehydrogenase family)